MLDSMPFGVVQPPPKIKMYLLTSEAGRGRIVVVKEIIADDTRNESDGTH
jgi:hypothetical protein